MRSLSRLLGAGAVASALFALVPLASLGESPALGPEAAASAPAATAPATVVDTKNFAYAPATITVHPGDSITFKNSDTYAHTVTATDGSFDSGNMDQGATWSHVFAKAGTFTYVCSYHSYMEGTIVVK